MPPASTPDSVSRLHPRLVVDAMPAGQTVDDVFQFGDEAGYRTRTVILDEGLIAGNAGQAACRVRPMRDEEKEAQRQKAEYDGKSDESGGISNPEHAHRVTKWVIISIPEVANPIDAMTIASPVTLHMKHAQRTHVMASMMLAFFSKFLYVFIVVSFILCGHIQYNM